MRGTAERDFLLVLKTQTYDRSHVEVNIEVSLLRHRIKNCIETTYFRVEDIFTKYSEITRFFSNSIIFLVFLNSSFPYISVSATVINSRLQTAHQTALGNLLQQYGKEEMSKSDNDCFSVKLLFMNFQENYFFNHEVASILMPKMGGKSLNSSLCFFLL